MRQQLSNLIPDHWLVSGREHDEGIDYVVERKVFIIDSSLSTSDQMRGRGFRGTRLTASCEAIRRFVACRTQMEAQLENYASCIAIVSFNNTADVALQFTPLQESAAVLDGALSQVRSSGGTDYIPALQAAQRLLAKDNLPASYPDIGFIDTIVFLTDGEHNGSGNPVHLAKKVKESGVLIFTIGVSDRLNPNKVEQESTSRAIEERLQDMASIVEGDRWYRFVSNFEELVSCFEQLAGNLVQ